MKIDIVSLDVIHSFAVPRLTGRLDAVPGKTNSQWIEAYQPGDLLRAVHRVLWQVARQDARDRAGAHACGVPGLVFEASQRRPLDGNRRRRAAHQDLRTEAERRARVGDDGRPQEDRDHVPLDHVPLLPRRRLPRAAGADPAGHARQHLPDAPRLQPGLHDARDDDDLPVRHPDVVGLRQLHRAAADRRPRHGLPPDQRLQLLADPAGRRRPVRRLLWSRRASSTGWPAPVAPARPGGPATCP